MIGMSLLIHCPNCGYVDEADIDSIFYCPRCGYMNFVEDIPDEYKEGDKDG